MRSLLALCSLLALAAPAQAAIETDRPDIAETSSVVSRGVYQLEQAIQADGEGAVNGLTFPSLHRLGLGNHWELRLETPVTRLSSQGGAFEELAVGAKWHVLDGGGPGEGPSVALLGHAIVDANTRVSPLGKVLVDLALPAGFDLAFNGGGTWDAATGPAAVFATAIAHDLVGELAAYGEVSGVVPTSGQAVELGLDGGVTYLLTPDVQLDMAVYKGLTPAAVDWYVTTGLSFRTGR